MAYFKKVSICLAAAVLLIVGALGAQSLDNTLPVSGNDTSLNLSLASMEMYSSFLQPQKIAVLNSEVDGVILEVKASPQDFVSQGDPLIVLDSELMQTQLESYRLEVEMSTVVQEAQISLAYANDNLDIIKKLYETEIGGARVGSEKEYKEALQRKELSDLALKKGQKELQLMQLKVRQTEILLEKHTIRAPMDGVIVPFNSVKGYDQVKEVTAGEMLRTAQPVAAMMKVAVLRVSEPKPVSALNSVALGQEAKVFIQGAKVPIAGKVVFISPTIASTGQFNVEVEFDNPPIADAAGYRYQFRPGMRARIELAEQP